jgi:hypothetical protein
MTLSIQGAQCLYVAPVDVSQAKLVTSLSTEGSLCDHVTGFGNIFCMMGDAVLKAIAQIVSDLVQKLEGTMTDVVSTHGLPEGVSGAMIALDMELCKAAQLKTIELKPILYTNPATQINVYGLVTVGTAKHTYPLPKGAPTIKAKNMDTGTFESLSCQSSSTLDVNIAGDISVCILPTELMNSASPLEVAFDASVGCNTSCYYQQTVDFSKAVNVETNVSVADVCGEKSGFCAILVYPIIKAVSVIVGTLITSAL